MKFCIRAITVLLIFPSVSLAQPSSGESRSFTLAISAGPMQAERGVDALGGHVEGGILYRIGSDFGLKLDLAQHWTGAQTLYPCILQDADYCYQTIRRSVAASILSATYHISRLARESGHTVPYLIAGAGVYRSRKVAMRYSDCQPPEACVDRATHRLEMRDTQFGWSGGLGLDFDLGPVAAFSELRVHYIRSDTPRIRSSNDYFLVPISVGVRF
jgi:hypothetical protein